MTREFGRFLRRNSIALLALFLALGGTTYAASSALLPNNSVGSKQVINGSLQTVDLSKKARKALKGNRGLRGLTGTKGATGPVGTAGPKGDIGPKGATGPQGPSGLVAVGSFTPSQIVEGATLTCTTPSGANCTGLKLNGSDVRLSSPEAIRVCNTVTGKSFTSGSGSGTAANPHFIWDGTTWKLDSASVAPMQNLSCTP
jgi:hypothetical protein